MSLKKISNITDFNQTSRYTWCTWVIFCAYQYLAPGLILEYQTKDYKL